MAEGEELNNDVSEYHELNSDGGNNLAMQLSLDDQTTESISNTFMDQEECTSKRTRQEEEEQNERWQEVIKKSKKRNIPTMDLTPGQGKKLTEICITCKNALPKRFALSKLFRDHDVSNVSKIKYINPFKVLVQFDKEESAERFLSNQVFVKQYGWRNLRTYEVGLSYGIVRDIDLGLEDKEIMENMISDVEIVSIKRLNKRNTEESGWVESEVIRVCFKGDSLPSYVYLFEIRARVEPYIFPVSQCSKCWRFGHTHKLCPKKITCPKCTGNHANCETTTYKCRNCTGSHMALDKTCPIYQKEKTIREIMSESNVTYKRAAEIYASLGSPVVNKPPRVDFLPPTSMPSVFNFKHNSNTQQPLQKRDQITYFQALPSETEKITTAEIHNPPTLPTSNQDQRKPRRVRRRLNKKDPNLTREHHTDFGHISDDQSTVMESEYPDAPAPKPKMDNEDGAKDKSTIGALLKKLKDIIFSKRGLIVDKIKTAIQVCCSVAPVNVPKEWITIHGTCRSAMRRQIQMEVRASLQYLAMGAHFSRDGVNRPGFAKLFFDAASEEREHALKLIDYMLMRGELTHDVSSLIKIRPPESKTWEAGVDALEQALMMENEVTKSIRTVIAACEDDPEFNDYHLVDYLTGEFLEEQYKGQRDLAGKATTLKKMMDRHSALGEFLFDKKLLGMDI